MIEQLELAYAGVASFGHRPFLTEADQLDAWRPDVAIVGAPFDIATTNRPGARFGPRYDHRVAQCDRRNGPWLEKRLWIGQGPRYHHQRY